ncbi:helix-turn-helix domain-containing protein [Actinomadura atramentaria]|uniref:helix-turn-helix domain-containing protein n=1 Tax=Actinomadura atramentaria TaxID=1990 RepID=UPI0003700CF9|nr:helix-turn-helix domain-containing protein [Actinomadura atramentaria]
MSIGETLADAREQAGLTIAQVSLRTRIRESVIRSIERDDFGACGGDFYARGHIRTIARVVGADPEPLVRSYDEAHGGAPQPSSASMAWETEGPLVPFRERRTPNWTAAMGIALAALLVVAGVQFFGGGSGGRHPARQVADKPVRAASSPAAPRAAGPVAAAPRKNVELRVKARRATWVNVRGDKGRQLFSGLLRSGASKQWKAKKKITVTIGNGGGVRLTVNGKDLGTPGETGNVVHLAFTPSDPESA